MKDFMPNQPYTHPKSVLNMASILSYCPLSLGPTFDCAMGFKPWESGATKPLRLNMIDAANVMLHTAKHYRDDDQPSPDVDFQTTKKVNKRKAVDETSENDDDRPRSSQNTYATRSGRQSTMKVKREHEIEENLDSIYRNRMNRPVPSSDQHGLQKKKAVSGLHSQEQKMPRAVIKVETADPNFDAIGSSCDNTAHYPKHRLQGAVWDIFPSESLPKVRQFLQENCRKNAPDRLKHISDPLHEDMFYLTPPLLLQLYREQGIRPIRIFQDALDTVFIPAGFAYQVCNYGDCVNATMTFVSPESIQSHADLRNGYRQLDPQHKRRQSEYLIPLEEILWEIISQAEARNTL